MNVPETRIVGGLAQFAIPAVGAANTLGNAGGTSLADMILRVQVAQ